MKVSGFSIARNAIKYGYPLAEVLRSLAPLVDEIVVAVGRSEDDTLDLVRSLGLPGLRIIETVWDESLREGGRILAQQTNVALAACRHPWALYLQADEVLHEEDQPAIRQALARWGGSSPVDALSFRFLHFEATYAYINRLRYRRQCRLVRNDGTIESTGDAAGFGRKDGAKLRVRRSGARIFHYGWVRDPRAMQEKVLAFQKLYHDDAVVQRRWGEVPAEELSDVDIAFRYRGSHPAAMKERIGALDWQVPAARRPPLDSPLLNPQFYAAWLRKWHLLPPRR